MDFAQYLAQDATGLAQCVARGEVSPNELLDLALARARQVQGRINAVSRLMEEQARAQLARPLTGPFAGVPYLLKDVLQDYAGIPTTEGSRALRNHVPAAHAAVVRRALDAGLVVFGKTNLPEFALKAVSDSRFLGRVNNPWDLARTPGGSSGGAAAAVAAGIVPMAAGNDGGGSIRIPAACCALFGLRPSRGRISAGPARSEVWFGASSEGVLSRSVRDTAHALDVLQGPEPGDPFVIAPPAEPYGTAMHRAAPRLRVGFTAASPIGTPVHPQAVAAVREAALLLQELGHDVQEAAPAIDGAALAESFLNIYFGNIAAAISRARGDGARHGDFEPMTRAIAAIGRAQSAGALTHNLARVNDFGRALGRFHAQFDLLLTPTLAEPPITHGTGDASPALEQATGLLESCGLLTLLARMGVLDSMVNALARGSLRFVPFTQLANMTGTPAMSVPLYWTRAEAGTPAGLPLGVQFVGRFGSEDILLQLARQLEIARPWFHRLPPWVTEPAST